MLRPPFYLLSKARMFWVIRVYRHHRLLSRLTNYSTVSLILLLGDQVFLVLIFSNLVNRVPGCKQKQGSGWEGLFQERLHILHFILSELCWLINKHFQIETLLRAQTTNFSLEHPTDSSYWLIKGSSLLLSHALPCDRCSFRAYHRFFIRFLFLFIVPCPFFVRYCSLFIVHCYCSLFSVRYSMFVIRYSMFVIRCSLVVIRCLLFDVRYSLFNVRYSLFDIRYSTFVIQCSLFDIWLFVTCYSPFIICGSLFFNWQDHLPSTPHQCSDLFSLSNDVWRLSNEETDLR